MGMDIGKDGSIGRPYHGHQVAGLTRKQLTAMGPGQLDRGIVIKVPGPNDTGGGNTVPVYVGSVAHLDVYEGSRNDEGGRVWQVKVSDYAEVLASEAGEKDAEALRLVSQFLSLCPDGSTLSAISEKTKVSRDRLKRLLPTDQIVEAQVPDRGSKNKTRTGYKLAQKEKAA
jgi:hypothetical protein